MQKEIIPGKLPFPFSAAVKVGGFVFLSGQLPVGPDGNMQSGPIEVQTKLVIEGIKKTLAEAGCDLSDVVKTTVWLQDTRDFPGFNKVYAQYFSQDYPARSTVRADLVQDVRLEVEVIAFKSA
jgi:2-iminobutanoate/2-iminopropanoate deaminase